MSNLKKRKTVPKWAQLTSVNICLPCGLLVRSSSEHVSIVEEWFSFSCVFL